MRINLQEILFFWFILVLPFSLFGKEEKRVEWEAVAGASYYLVDIRTEGEIIHSLKTANNWLPLFLNRGNYQIRVAVYNKFDKLASVSEWSDLTIYPSVQPSITSLSPSRAVIPLEELSMEVTGNNIDSQAVFILSQRDLALEGEVMSFEERGDQNLLEVTFDGTSLVKGDYDLTVTNPSGKKHEKIGGLTLIEGVKPVITSLDPFDVYHGINNGPLTMGGQNFTPDSQVLIDGEVRREASHVEVFLDREITFLLDAHSLEPGAYWLTVRNGTGLISNPYQLKLEEKELSKEEKIRRERMKENLQIGLLYSPTLPMTENQVLYENSYLGLGLTLRTQFNNPGIYSIPILRNGGVCLSVDYTYLSSPIKGEYRQHAYALGGGLFFLTHSDLPLNLYASVTMGAVHSLISPEPGVTVPSTDFYHRLSLALQLSREAMTWEAGLMGEMIHYRYRSHYALKPYLLVGRKI